MKGRILMLTVDQFFEVYPALRTLTNPGEYLRECVEGAARDNECDAVTRRVERLNQRSDYSGEEPISGLLDKKAKSEPGSVLTVKGALRLIGPTAPRTDRTAPATSERLPEGFEPQPGKYLYGRHRLFERGSALVAESAKHPGY